MSIVTIVPSFTSAREFLDALSPIGDHFNEAPIGTPWLFRGQGKDHPLIPSLFRQGALNKLTHRNITLEGQLLLAERDILIKFFNIADKRGLMLPDDSQELRAKLEDLSSDTADNMIPMGSERWHPMFHVASLMALAQHYGLPTRLLDWTRLSYIAAYFAAEGAQKHLDDLSGNMVVWAFYFPSLGQHDQITRETAPLQVVTAPSATNPNLKAQQGVFTLLNPLITGKGATPCPPFQEFLEEWESKEGWGQYMISHCRLRKFSLPHSEAEELLYLLAKVDITPSAVFPGFGSIVSDLKMRHEW